MKDLESKIHVTTWGIEYTRGTSKPKGRILKTCTSEDEARKFIEQRRQDALRFHEKHPKRPGGINRR